MAKINVKVTDEISSDLSPDDIQAKIDAQMSTAVKKPAATKVSIVAKEPAVKPIARKAVRAAIVSEEKPSIVKPTEPTVVSHRGKVLNPKIEEAKVESDTAVDVVETKPVEKVATVKPAEAAEEEVGVGTEVADDKSTEKAVETEEAKEVKSEELAPEESKIDAPPEKSEGEPQEAKPKEDEVQQPQIFDTNQYHLPIKATKHNKHDNGNIVALLVLLVVLVVAYVGADMGMYDPGFKLPYDIF